MDAATALNELRANPDHFIRYYPLQLAGPTLAYLAGAANMKTMYLAKRDVGYMATHDGKEGHYGASRPGPLGIGRRNLSSFSVLDYNGAQSVPFNAYGVPMVNYNSAVGGRVNLGGAIGAMPSYHLGPAGDGIMITGQLSGCCFAWTMVGGTMWCIHVQPIGHPGTGTQLQTDIDAGGHFAGHAGGLSTYGLNDYNGSYAIVIGVRLAGTWRLYAQRSNDQGRTIISAHRLHPGGLVNL